MNAKKIGALIKKLRLENSMTQAQLAEKLAVSDKTVSKWERGAGCPDISLLPLVASLFKIDLQKILSDELTENEIDGGNMKNTQFYVCPVCGCMTCSTGGASIACCGRTLDPLPLKKAEEQEKLQIEKIEDEWFIQADHPMTKENYISFIAFLSGGSLHILRQYPEWDLQVRLPARGHGRLIWFSTTKGLFYMNI